MRENYLLATLSVATILLACALLTLILARGERYHLLETTYQRGDMRFPRIIVFDSYSGRAVRSYQITNSGFRELEQTGAPRTETAPVLAAHEGD